MTATPPSRVVIADDSPDIRLLFEAIIETEPDFELVATAADGVEAVEVVGRVEPDVIILDLSMPRMDGLEAIPLIQERSPNTAVVVLSGFLGDPVRAQVEQLGALTAIEKGTPIPQMLEQIRDSLRIWRART